MKKKIIITIVTTIILTSLFIIAKNLIYGTDIDYIADYMPGPLTEMTRKPFASLAYETTMLRLFWFIIFNVVFSIFYTIILFKIKLYKTKKDVIYTFVVFIVPLTICYVLIRSQLSATF